MFLLIVYDANGKEIATGTGFLVSNDGNLITNHHVIAKAHKMVAKAENGGLFPIAGLLAVNAANDLALLKLEGKNLTSLPLGSSEKVEAGVRIVVIGRPLGLEEFVERMKEKLEELSAEPHERGKIAGRGNATVGLGVDV